MSSTIAANYRSYRLPWTPSEAEERLYRRIMAMVIGLFIAFGIIIPFLPTPPKPAVEQPVPERIVEFILEQKKPPEEVEPPKPVEVPKVEARILGFGRTVGSAGTVAGITRLTAQQAAAKSVMKAA